jgi:predicted regulator of Ras-like GTPase activity (Roadblock/LC7/MglB family)
MSFAAILQKIVDQGGGILGAALMGTDGIAIEQVRAHRGGDAVLADEPGAAGVEFGRILEDVRKASDSLGGGALAEAVISLARFTLVFRIVDDETFLVVAIDPHGNLGKARYLVRRHLLEIREQL